MESEPVRRRIRLFLLSLVGLGVLLAVFCFFPEVDGQAGKPIVVESQTNKPFKTWNAKPELVIVFSGQMHGYIQACGCSWPQWGGLTRRYNFIQTLQKKGWPVVAIDVGEIAPERGSQAMLKYITSMNALDAMGYDAFALGLNEMNMPAFQALANFSVTDRHRRTIATNLSGTENAGMPFYDLEVRQFRIVNRVNPAVGFYNIVDTKIQKKVTDDDCKFLSPRKRWPMSWNESKTTRTSRSNHASTSWPTRASTTKPPTSSKSTTSFANRTIKSRRSPSCCA